MVTTDEEHEWLNRDQVVQILVYGLRGCANFISE